jgi:hypothetical protein
MPKIKVTIELGAIYKGVPIGPAIISFNDPDDQE